jgi:flagellar biosynthetic protein FliQ
MTLDQATELIRHALLVALLIAAPVLAVGLLVGFITSLLQAVTSIQDQTLSLIPRIVATIAITIVLAPWMGQHLVEYARQLFTEALR